MRLFEHSRYRDPEMLADEVFLLFEGARISIQCGGRGPASRVVKMLRDLLAGTARATVAAATHDSVAAATHDTVAAATNDSVATATKPDPA